jgi:hypothetical protein
MASYYTKGELIHDTTIKIQHSSTTTGSQGKAVLTSSSSSPIQAIYHFSLQLPFKSFTNPSLTSPFFLVFVSALSMASRNLFNARANYNYPTPGSGNNPITGHDDVFELDEADVWDSNVAPLLESKKTIPSSRCSKRDPRKFDHMAKDGTPVTCASLPVNIPDWSKIYNDHQKKEDIEGSVHPVDDDTDYDNDGDDDDDDQDGRVPPHEYLARRRGASFSVHEGIGRTLKGRDLRQVRNAIWKRVGFED